MQNSDKKVQPQGKPVLSNSQRSLIFVGLFRQETFFKRVQPELASLKFSEINKYYEIVLNGLLSFHKQYHILPMHTEFVGHMEALLQARPVQADVSATVWQLISMIYQLSDKDIPNTEVLCVWFNQLVEEQLALELQQSLLKGSFVHKDISEHLDTYKQKLGVARSVIATALEEPFTDNWAVQEVKVRTPYGVDFIDRYLAGGGAPGEVYLLLGPFGSCKTTLLTQLSVALAENKYYDYVRCPRGGLGMVYFVSYEESLLDMRIRAVCNKTKIPRDVFEKEGFQSLLSSGGNLNYRDREYYGDAIGKGIYLPTETERLARATSELNMNWRVLDLSTASSSGTGRGTGAVTEIRNAIEADLNRQRASGTNCYCAGVFVDYLELMVDNYLEYNPRRQDPSVKFEMLKRSGDLFVREIGSIFNAPVFVLHQLNKAGNDSGIGIVPHYTKASGCGSVGRGYTFVFVISKQSDDGYCCIDNQKHRYNKQLPMAVLKVRGDICEVRWDEDKIYDGKSKKFADRAEIDEIRGSTSRPIRNIPVLPE